MSMAFHALIYVVGLINLIVAIQYIRDLPTTPSIKDFGVFVLMLFLAIPSFLVLMILYQLLVGQNK